MDQYKFQYESHTMGTLGSIWGVITIKGFKTLTQEGTRSAEMWLHVPEIDMKVFTRCFPGHRVNLKNMT